MPRIWQVLLVLGCLAAGLVISMHRASGVNIIKGAAIALLVDRSAGSVNSAINNLTGSRNVSETMVTKVVPILSLGQGGYVGAVQVAGSAQAVDAVKAVMQLEGSLGRSFRLKALVPINTRALTNYQRVNGVGVSAIIDVSI